MAPQLVLDVEVETNERQGAWNLRFKDGDRVIALDDQTRHHLVHDSEVLCRTSDFFQRGANDAWTGLAKQVTHPDTGQEIKVLTYYLVHDHFNNILSLSQTTEGRCFEIFHLSKLAHGFRRRRGHSCEADIAGGRGVIQGRRFSYTYAEEVRETHRVILQLLYGEDPNIICVSDCESIAEIAAYAELYDLFAAIGPALNKLLLNTYRLWHDVQEDCQFHISLAQKLRCEEVFVDAMRHYIGSGLDLFDLTYTHGLDFEYAFTVARVRDAQKKRIARLTDDILALTLSTYIPDAANTKLGIGKPVKTSFFSRPHTPTHGERVADTARHIFTDWLNHQRLGDKHWNFVRDNPKIAPYVDPWDSASSADDDSEPKAESTHGVHAPGSFRGACAAAVRAIYTDDELTLFDLNVAEASVRASSLPNSPYTTMEVQEELKKLVNKMAWLAMPLLLPSTCEYGLELSARLGIDLTLRDGSQALQAQAENKRALPSKDIGSGTVPQGTVGYAHTFLNVEAQDARRRG